jgi:hypothetical protein
MKLTKLFLIITILSKITATTLQSRLMSKEPTETPVYVIQHQNNWIPQQSNSVVVHPISCPCASQVSCQPCGMTVFPQQQRIVDCPCAPKPNCPKCPPLSLIHDLASKKVK